ncbi:hypothetical protein [Pseudomonas abieticivorans]|uniref:hypothetical protein n=1 Tax=Pseudomonas abieticivorans TaxID=2931382 RepID=UPI0020C0D6EF|nr:hypothetical protein [Pseudomonas sp. PIA16]
MKYNLVDGDEKVDVLETSRDISARLKTAQAIDWGVVVDGYLVNAAAVGRVYAASLYSDHSQKIADGETVVTPPVTDVYQQQGFTLLRSFNGFDHYVVVSQFVGDT